MAILRPTQQVVRALLIRALQPVVERSRANAAAGFSADESQLRCWPAGEPVGANIDLS